MEPTALERRVAAAQATLDAFNGRPFEWGKTDCARLAAHTLRQLGLPAPLSKFGTYSTALGAARALRRRGFSDLGGVLDSIGLFRIPPAAALPADFIALRAIDLPTTLTVALGNGRVLGFHEEAEGAVVMQPNTYIAAWRTL